MGRPLAKIDIVEFEKLCALGFNSTGICQFFDCCENDLNLFCEKMYGENFDKLIYEIQSVRKINRKGGKQYVVYMHIAPNDKKYIGVTKCNLSKRFDNGNGYKYNEHFYNAIKKYGWENIKHAVLYSGINRSEAERLEKELIKKFKSNDRRYGYNIEGGGMLNKEVSQETRDKLRKNATGVIPTQETRQKMSKSHSGQKCHWYGTHLSEEKKENLRKLKSKKINSTVFIKWRIDRSI